MHKTSHFATLLFCLCSALALRAQTGSIQGSIYTSDKQPAPYVNVHVDGTAIGSSTDDKGLFSITDIPAGTHTLTASSVGLTQTTQSVLVEEGKTTTVTIHLVPSKHQLREVVVAAESRSYNPLKPSPTLRIQSPLLEVPQNIQVLDEKVFRDQQSFDMLEGIQRNISGAQRVEHWDNYARINMRGSQLTPFRNGMNVKLSPWSPLAEDMSMVERIEFVKGPAGFMLATGEPGGFYNVVTKKPTGTRRGEATFTMGSFDTYRTTLDLDGKLSADGKLLYRLNVMGQMKGSHRDFEFNNRYSIAPVIQYRINPQSTLTLEYNEQFSQVNAIGSNYAFSANGYADLPIHFTTAEPNMDPSEMRDRSMMVRFEHALSAQWSFTAQTALMQFEQEGQSLWPWAVDSAGNMQRGVSIWDAYGLNKNAQAFVNGTVETGFLTHEVLGGIDMSHKDYYADWSQGAALGDTFNIYAPTYGTISSAEMPRWDRSQDIRERGVGYTNSYSGLYLQDQIGMFENKLRITLAGRYTRLQNVNPYSGTTDDARFTPRAGISWSVLPSLSTYAVYDEVFLANPGFDWQGRAFDPISGNNVEVGLKKQWFDGKWSSTLAVYRITKNNVLTTDLEHPDPVTGQFIYSIETGQQRVEGVEVDVKGELLEGLTLIANYAYTDARVTQDANPELVGSKVAGATEHLQNTWLNYRFGSGKLRGLKLSLGYQYQAGRSSWYVFDQSDNPLPDYFRLDGSIGYAIGRFKVDVLVNNILDEYLYSGAPYYGSFYWQAEAGRNYRMTIGFTF